MQQHCTLWGAFYGCSNTVMLCLTANASWKFLSLPLWGEGWLSPAEYIPFLQKKPTDRHCWHCLRNFKWNIPWWKVVLFLSRDLSILAPKLVSAFHRGGEVPAFVLVCVPAEPSRAGPYLAKWTKAGMSLLGILTSKEWREVKGP